MIGILTKVCDENNMITTLLANNAGPFTGPGTQTHVFGDQDSCVVIDPGPSLPEHMEAIYSAIGHRKLCGILLTHRHGDHAGAALTLQVNLNTSIMAFPILPSDHYRIPEGRFYTDFDYEAIHEGDEITVGSLTLSVVHTPGHCFDHVAFVCKQTGDLFVGDTIMAWSSTAIVQPEGNMEAYRQSLRKLYHIDVQRFHPTHGDIIHDPKVRIVQLLAHRRKREEELFSRLGAEPMGLSELRKIIYPQLPENLYAGAETSLLSHILDLNDRGIVTWSKKGVVKQENAQCDPMIWNL